MIRSIIILISTLTICSLLLVNSQQKTRALYILLEQLRMEERVLNQEWLRLEFEQRNLSNTARISEIANQHLHMTEIDSEKTQYAIVYQ